MFWCALAWIPLSLVVIGFWPWDRGPGVVYWVTFIGFFVWMAICYVIREMTRGPWIR